MPKTRESLARLWCLLREVMAWKLYHLACGISPEFKNHIDSDSIDVMFHVT